MNTEIPRKAIDLILESEGIDQPSKWPGGGSGITLGYGCDIGADPGSLGFWEGILTPPEIQRLSYARGVTGVRAKWLADEFEDIHITAQMALPVFLEQSLPREISLTLKAFPGVELMPPEVLGAMVSLVYNRGTSIAGERRHEMRIIYEILAEFKTFDPVQRAACQREYMTKIANQFKRMKRLWVGKGLDGLLARRDAEASLIMEAIG